VLLLVLVLLLLPLLLLPLPLLPLLLLLDNRRISHCVSITTASNKQASTASKHSLIVKERVLWVKMRMPLRTLRGKGTTSRSVSTW